MKTLRFIAVLALLATLSFAETASAYTFTLSDASGSRGSDVSVNLSVTLADGDPTLYALQCNLLFDPAQLRYNGFNPTDLVLVGSDNGLPYSPVTLALPALGLEGLSAGGSYDLGALSFTITGASPYSIIELTDLQLGTELFGDMSEPDSATWASSTVSADQTPVPEPGTVLLTGAGLLALFACRRRSS